MENDTLFIVGNGFDCNHCLKSSYYFYRQYLIDNGFKKYVDYFGYPNFSYLDRPEEETGIHEGLVDGMTRDQYGKQLAKNYDDVFEKMKKNDWCWNELETMLSTIQGINGDGLFVKEFADIIIHQLPNWMSSFVKPQITAIVPKYGFPQNQLYLNFNYTELLENVYNIPASKVLHIHGKIGDSSLMFGHSQYEYINELIGQPQYGAYSHLNYYKDTLKDVKLNITNHNSYWIELANVEKIYVLGHSLGDADLSYFEKISAVCPKARWFITYYVDSNGNDSRNVIKKTRAYSLIKTGAEFISWDELNEVFPLKSASEKGVLVSSYPDTMDEFKDYVKKALSANAFYGKDDKHKSDTYDGSTSACSYFSVFNKDLSDPQKFETWIDEAQYSVSAFSAQNGKREYIVHPCDTEWSGSSYVGSAYNRGDCIPLVGMESFDVVSGCNIGVHGFPVDDSYFTRRITDNELTFIKELE